MCGDFKQQTDRIVHEKAWTWKLRENLIVETESLLIAELNNAIRINHIKEKIDNT